MNTKDLNNGQILTHAFGLCLLMVAIASPFFLKAEAYDPNDPYGLKAAAAQEQQNTQAVIPPTQNSQPYGQPYGVNGTLDQSEVLALLYLDFSNGQSYESIKNRFGFPAMRNSTSDFYVMPNGHYAEIVYDTSNRAIALRLGDSGQ